MSEQPEPNAAEAQRWLEQAGEELRTARRVAGEDDLPSRIACFLAHLATEKALKAGLIRSGIAFTKVHDLADLRALLPTDVVVEISDADLALLNPWAIEGRYPGDIADATSSQAIACVEAADRVLAIVLAIVASDDS